MLRRLAISVSIAAISLSATFPAFAKNINVKASDGADITATVLAEFDSAWAMTIMPDVAKDGEKLGKITGAPDVTARGQGGLGDIILHPDFARTGQVYISYAERDEKDDDYSGAAVTLAKLTLTKSGGKLTKSDVIWRQIPKVLGNGHYGHRMAISDDRELFITSGERQKFSPSQNMASNLGKVVRLNLDGTAPEDTTLMENYGYMKWARETAMS